MPFILGDFQCDTHEHNIDLWYLEIIVREDEWYVVCLHLLVIKFIKIFYGSDNPNALLIRH